MKQADQVYGYWTKNGNVYAKKMENSKPVRIQRLGEIQDRLCCATSANSVQLLSRLITDKLIRLWCSSIVSLKAT